MTPLYNRVDRRELMEKAKAESLPRKIISFYRYAEVEEPDLLRAELYRRWFALGILGRIYIAKEGINAHMSVPENAWSNFLDTIKDFPLFDETFINQSSQSSEYAFFKLDVRVRNTLVVHRLIENPLETTSPAEHLSPKEFHQMLHQDDVVVVDARNKYECDIGHFENAITPSSRTFSTVLPELKEKLSGYEDKTLLMYCTGGIRCEVASAYLKREGFKKVFQLQGGIIHYVNKMKKSSTPSKYKGSVYVFDERMAEKNEDRIGTCYQCGNPHSAHSNCGYIHCHCLMIQCPSCAEKLAGCCTPECKANKDNLG